MSSIINTQNVTFPSQNSSVTIILPSSSNTTYVFNDQTASNAGTCTRDSILTYRTTLQTIYSNVVLDCSCASINLKAIFEESNSAILNYFTCSNTTNAANYTSSTLASCGSSALNFSNGLCSNQSLGVCLNDHMISYTYSVDIGKEYLSRRYNYLKMLSVTVYLLNLFDPKLYLRVCVRVYIRDFFS